jgi:phospholipid/cholesterol/gamma-HCH transport system substrate-binding protein
VAAAHYDPATGQVAVPNGQVFTQADLVGSARPDSWRELVMPQGIS